MKQLLLTLLTSVCGQLLRFNPRRQFGTTLLLPPPHGGTRGRFRRVKVRKLRGWDKASSMGKVKAARKQSKIRDSVSIPHQQANVQPLPGKQGSAMHSSHFGRQTPQLQTSSLPLYFLTTFIAEHDIIRYGTHVWSAVPAACPIITHPQPTHRQDNVRNIKGHDAAQALFSNS